MEERILIQGYLMKAPDGAKHLQNFKKWQRKWCVLDESGDLNYYDSDKKGRSLGVLHMRQCLLILDPQTKGVQLNYSLGFQFPDHTSYVKMESTHLFNGWLSLLRDFAEKCDVEEIPEEERRGTITSHLSSGGRAGSISSVQSRGLGSTVKSRFRSKEGVMSKTGSNNKGWKERYFLLSKGSLSYYKNEKSVHTDTSLGSIDLFECSSITKTAGKRGYGFDLHLPSRVFNFSNESDVDQAEWISLITHTLGIIADIKGTTLSGGGDTLDVVSVHSNVSGASLEKILEEDGKDVKVMVNSKQQEDKDGVVQLLEAEVEALRSKVSSLEADLRSSSNVNSQLQTQLVEERSEKNKKIKELKQEKEDLSSQLEQVEREKENLETINDSIQAQLEEQQDKTLILEEEQMNLRQDLEEAHTANTAIEEELAETQTKLQEIEEVAMDLEASLRKRGGSEPPPPPSSDLTNLRSLNLSYKAKMEEEGSRSLAPTQPLMEEDNKAMEEMKEKLSKVEKERDDALQLTSVPHTSPPQEGTPPITMETVEGMVHEERLKWQVEVVNIRRELDGKLEEERGTWDRERDRLKQDISKLKEELKSSKTSAKNQMEQLQANTGRRIVELEGEVSAASERVGQLLVEKEKALADLKTIRKTNRTMEKRMSENEGLRRTSSPIAPIITPTGSLTTPTTTVKENSTSTEDRATDAIIISDLKSQLTNVEKERDHLKVQLEKLISSQGADKKEGVVPVASPSFPFLRKSQAAVGTSGPSVGGKDRAPPTSSIRNGLTMSSENPPPKPRKPPKELLDQYTISSAPPPPIKRQPLSLDEDGLNDLPPPSIRTRTMSMIQTLFAHR